MSDFDEHEDEPGVEIIDLDTPQTEGQQGNRELLPPPSAPGLLRPRKPVGRRQLQIVGAGIVALLLLALLLNTSGLLASLVKQRAQPASSRVKGAASVHIVAGTLAPTQTDGISCLMDAAWSPDSDHVSVLGYSTDCPQERNSYEPGLLNIYDAHTGKLMQQVKPDKPVISTLDKQFPSTHITPIIYYQNVRWSPNGQEIAVSFAEFLPGQNASSFFGVYLINPDSQNAPTVFLWKQTQDLTTSYLLWDLQSGKAKVVPSNIPLSPFISPSMPAVQEYQWGADGTLLPVQSASSNSGPVGNPDRDQTFTPWQSGELARVTETDNKPTHLPGIYTWMTFLTAWSPDGRYLAMLVSIVARLIWPSQPQPSHQALVDLEADKLGTLPVRDRALKALIDALPIGPGGYSGLEVAWRPDGRVLATYNSGNIDLYDCTTGRKLASLIPNQGNSTALKRHTGCSELVA